MSEVSTAVYKGKIFCKLSDGLWLQEKWKHIYNYYAGRLAPKTWRESLERTTLDSMLAVATTKKGFCPGSASFKYILVLASPAYIL